MVRPSRRGGVPVLSRPTRNGRARSFSASALAGASPARPPLIARESDVDPSAEERAGGEHHRVGAEGEAHGGHHAGDAGAARPVFEEQVVDGLLKEREAGLGLEPAPDLDAVELAVDLGPGRPDGRAAARVQGAEVDAASVRGGAHRAAQGVDLAHEVPLADSADGRVAAHLAEGLDRLGEEQGARARARRGEGRLGAGVPAADDDDVEFACGWFMDCIWLAPLPVGVRSGTGERTLYRVRVRVPIRCRRYVRGGARDRSFLPELRPRPGRGGGGAEAERRRRAPGPALSRPRRPPPWCCRRSPGSRSRRSGARRRSARR